MSPSLEIIDPLEYPAWDRLLLDQQSYSFFHSSAWARVLVESYQYRPRYFIARDGCRLSALVPLMEVKSLLTGTRGVCLPFTDYCDPLTGKGQSSEIMNELILFGRSAKWDSIEIRSGNYFAPDPRNSAAYSVHTLELSPGADRLFRNFRDNTRRNIKKAIKEGVTVAFYGSADAMADFYRLNCQTRKMHGLPPQPVAFFRNLHEHVIAPGLGCVALAGHRGRTVAGAVYLYSREKIIYKYGASLIASQHLRSNNLIMWKAIEFACKQGFQRLCFGRTDLDQEGLRQFKAGWGGDERIIDYYKYDLKKDAFVESNSLVSGVHTAFWKHVPLSLSRLAGRLLYRHVG